jgi:poly(A) polymerase Pap1
MHVSDISENHIYNKFHGFLKGISVTIMAAKIATMFPNGTVPFLLQMFYLYFIEWQEFALVQIYHI